MEKYELPLSEDPLKIYLNQIGQYDVLTREEEIELSAIYNLGQEAEVYAQSQIDNNNPVDEITQQAIIDGREAKERFIEANLRLVVSIAKNYNSPRHSLDFLDLIQDGNQGLFKAVEKFDAGKGFKFSTYATWWIKQAIQRGINNAGTTIRIPVHASDSLYAFERAEAEVDRENHTDTPKDDLIAAKLGVKKSNIQDFRNLKKIKQITSFDTPVNDDYNANTLSDFIKDENQPDQEQVVQVLASNLIIEDLLGHLDEKAKKVMILRFGLGEDEPKTLEEIGNIFGLTRERIRQIEQRSLKILLPKAKKLGAVALLDGN